MPVSSVLGQPRSGGGIRVKLLALFAFLLVAYLSGLAVLGLLAGGIHQADARGEVAIVFYGDAGPLSRERLAAAVRLYHANAVDRVVIVGGSRPARAYNGAEWLAGLAVQAGVPEARIDYGRHSFDTITNIRESLEHVEADERLVLVSDCLHLLRIRWLAHRIAPDRALMPYCSPGQAGLLRTVRRANHEALAWASMLLPSGLREWMVRQGRLGSKS